MKLNPIKANMNEIETSNYTVLFSYKTPVACYQKTDNLWYRTSTKWSATTSRHINQWLPSKDCASEMPQDFFDNLV